jgi:hypothetical protein
LLCLADVGLERGEPFWIAGRERPPVCNANQEDFGLKRVRIAREVGFFRSIDKFLDVGRHLVPIGEQKVAARQHLPGRFTQGKALDLELGNPLGRFFVKRAVFRRRGRRASLLQKLRHFRQTLLGFRE